MHWPAWKMNVDLVGTADKIHPSKMVLQAVSSDGSGGMTAYRTYLQQTLNLNASHSVIGSLSDAILSRFYSLDSPLVPPKFFDWSAGGGQDVSRLEAACSVDIVIFESASKDSVDNPLWEVLHDRSVYRKLTGEDADRRRRVALFVTHASRARVASGKEGSPETAFYLAKDGWEKAGELMIDHHHQMKEANYVDTSDKDKDKEWTDVSCYYDRWARLLRRQLAADHVHSPLCQELVLALSDYRSAAASMTPHVEFCVTAHLRTSSYRQKKLKIRYFGMLMAPSGPSSSCAVLSVLSDYTWISLPKDKAELIMSKEVRVRYPSVDDPPPPLTGLRPGAGGCRKPKRKASEHSCDCQGCENSHLYDKAMNDSGPAMLYTHATTLFDLMRSLGVFDSASEAIVNRCCELSTAALDVETFTVGVNPEAGNEDAVFPYASMSERRLPRIYTARMEPVLIGYADTLSIDQAEAGGGATVFGGWSKEDETRTKRKLVSDFCRHLDARKEEASVAKIELLSPLLEWVARYREAYTDYFRDSGYLLGGGSDGGSQDEVLDAAADELVRSLADMDCDELEEEWDTRADESESVTKLIRARAHRLRDSVSKAFAASIFGQFESALLRLASVFICFSHNGMGFDHIVIGADIVCHFKSAGRSVRMSRDGLKVRSIAVEGQLFFAESTLLLSPGTSLDALGKLAGLEIQKFRCPFLPPLFSILSL